MSAMVGLSSLIYDWFVVRVRACVRVHYHNVWITPYGNMSDVYFWLIVAAAEIGLSSASIAVYTMRRVCPNGSEIYRHLA